MNLGGAGVRNERWIGKGFCYEDFRVQGRYFAVMEACVCTVDVVRCYKVDSVQYARTEVGCGRAVVQFLSTGGVSTFALGWEDIILRGAPRS
jgi:hypothetical protein